MMIRGRDVFSSPEVFVPSSRRKCGRERDGSLGCGCAAGALPLDQRRGLGSDERGKRGASAGHRGQQSRRYFEATVAKPPEVAETRLEAPPLPREQPSV